jgi:acyl-CoA synthetase (AMP-forming)/AMP-acid ligase II
MTLVRQAAEPLPAVLRERARNQPGDVAYVFLANGEDPGDPLTYGELAAGVRVRAELLHQRGLAGARAVLLYPTGPEFIQAFLACAIARACGVPVHVPNRRRGIQLLRKIADDAGATTVLTTRAVRDDLLDRFGALPELSGLHLVATDEPAESSPLPATDDRIGPEPEADDLALLQYTSGSTGDPKGVMVTHANLWHNAEAISQHWPLGPSGAVVSWLPLFHDLGLMFGVVLPIHAGVPAYLMPPSAFMRRPMRWLEAVSRFRATHTAAPNFAYQLCVDAARTDQVPSTLDLSSLRAAMNGAEPVRWSTVRQFAAAFSRFGFSPPAMSPGYGLAEATLKVCGTPHGRPPHALDVSAEALREGRVVIASEAGPATATVVSCGTAAPGTRVRVVDADTGTARPAGAIGEVWVSGPCVARGYWGRPVASRLTFSARIRGEEGAGRFLRTGDLAFVHDGELYLTGRLKDVLVFRGRNHYPHDIEYTVEACHSSLRPACAAAFSVDRGDHEDLVVVVEVDGRVLRDTAPVDLAASIRTAIRDEHSLETGDIVFIRRGTLPRTTSGKIQRGLCRQSYVDKALQLVASSALDA